MLRNWKSSPAIALTSMLGVTAVWGSTFIVVQNAVFKMPVMDFLAMRFTIAALLMLAIRPSCLRGLTRSDIWHGVIMGLVLSQAYIAQTYGLLWASATVSGFITGMYVVLTPIISILFLGRKGNRTTWLAIILATVGLAMLSLHGWAIGIGEILTFSCALSCAAHIVGLGEWTPRDRVYGFTVVQIGTVAIVTLVASSPEGLTIPPDGEVWIAVIITAVLATAVGYLVQTWAQSLVSPVRVAVVMTMEPVFAGIFAVILGGDQLTWRILGGGACILAAMYIVQLKTASGSVPEADTG